MNIIDNLEWSTLNVFNRDNEKEYVGSKLEKLWMQKPQVIGTRMKEIIKLHLNSVERLKVREADLNGTDFFIVSNNGKIHNCIGRGAFASYKSGTTEWTINQLDKEGEWEVCVIAFAEPNSITVKALPRKLIDELRGTNHSIKIDWKLFQKLEAIE